LDGGAANQPPRHTVIFYSILSHAPHKINGAAIAKKLQKIADNSSTAIAKVAKNCRKFIET
jgi:hypothetical protein